MANTEKVMETRRLNFRLLKVKCIDFPNFINNPPLSQYVLNTAHIDHLKQVIKTFTKLICFLYYVFLAKTWKTGRISL